jgi:hypothetical protein
MLDTGAPTNIALGANATGATAASVPSTTSLIPCCTRASGRWCTGYSPPFCCALPAHPGALRGRWGSISAPVIGGAGGCAMRLCPMRWSVNWQGPSKRMTSTTPRARRGKPSRVGRRRWGVERGGAARNVSLVGAIMTKTGRRLSRGSVARGQLLYTQPEISRSRRCRRQLISRCARAVGSTRTRRVAIRR